MSVEDQCTSDSMKSPNELLCESVELEDLIQELNATDQNYQRERTGLRESSESIPNNVTGSLQPDGCSLQPVSLKGLMTTTSQEETLIIQWPISSEELHLEWELTLKDLGDKVRVVYDGDELGVYSLYCKAKFSPDRM